MSDNTNVGDVTGSGGKVDLSPGQNISFDEMLSVSEDTSEQEQIKTKPEKSTDKPEQKATKAKEEKEPAPKEGDDSKAKEEKNTEDKEAISEESEIKKLLGKRGEESLEIPADLTLEATVNGQKVPVSVQELLNQYSGKVAYDKKFTEFDKERKSFQSDREALESHVNGFVEKVLKSQKDPSMALSALADLAEVSGFNPLEFQRSLRTALMPNIEAYLKMSPQEREAHDIKEENKFLNSRIESEKQRGELAKSHEAKAAEFVALQEAHGLTGDELRGAFKNLSEHAGLSPEEIQSLTPAQIADYALLIRQSNHVYDVIAGIDAEVARNPDNAGVIAELVSLYKQNPEWKQEDLVEVINEVFAEDLGKKTRPSTVAKKLEKAAAATGTTLSTHSSKKSVNPASSPLTFDDLE